MSDYTLTTQQRKYFRENYFLSKTPREFAKRFNDRFEKDYTELTVKTIASRNKYNQPTENYYSVREASLLLQVCENTVRDYIQGGILKARRGMRSKYYIYADSFHRFYDSRRRRVHSCDDSWYPLAELCREIGSESCSASKYARNILTAYKIPHHKIRNRYYIPTGFAKWIKQSMRERVLLRVKWREFREEYFGKL